VTKICPIFVTTAVDVLLQEMLVINGLPFISKIGVSGEKDSKFFP
jgi:hypothetical protein